jgi:tetratricopeptide (TPR) repeat protein
MGTLDERVAAYFSDFTVADPALLMRELLVAGRVSDAVDVGVLALGTAPDDPDLLVTYSQALELDGDTLGARLALERAVEVDSVEADAWRRLADVSQRLGFPDDARDALAQAARLDPGHPALPGLRCAVEDELDQAWLAGASSTSLRPPSRDAEEARRSAFTGRTGRGEPAEEALDLEVDAMLRWLDDDPGSTRRRGTLPGLPSPIAGLWCQPGPRARTASRGRLRAATKTAPGIGAPAV